MKGALVLAARVTLALLFGYAALTKVGDMHQFAEDIANYQLVPARPGSSPSPRWRWSGSNWCARSSS